MGSCNLTHSRDAGLMPAAEMISSLEIWECAEWSEYVEHSAPWVPCVGAALYTQQQRGLGFSEPVSDSLHFVAFVFYSSSYDVVFLHSVAYNTSSAVQTNRRSFLRFCLRLASDSDGSDRCDSYPHLQQSLHCLPRMVQWLLSAPRRSRLLAQHLASCGLQLQTEEEG